MRLTGFLLAKNQVPRLSMNQKYILDTRRIQSKERGNMHTSNKASCNHLTCTSTACCCEQYKLPNNTVNDDSSRCLFIMLSDNNTDNSRSDYSESTYSS